MHSQLLSLGMGELFYCIFQWHFTATNKQLSHITHPHVQSDYQSVNNSVKLLPVKPVVIDRLFVFKLENPMKFDLVYL